MTTETYATPPPWANKPGFEPVQPYVTVGGDSLPLIAELYGHAGEWLAIAELNVGVWPDYNNVQPGLSLTMPAEWIGAETKPAGGNEPEAVAEALDDVERGSSSRAHARRQSDD